MKAFLDQKLSMLDDESWKFVMKEDEKWEVGGERNGWSGKVVDVPPGTSVTNDRVK